MVGGTGAGKCGILKDEVGWRNGLEMFAGVFQQLKAHWEYLREYLVLTPATA